MALPYHAIPRGKGSKKPTSGRQPGVPNKVTHDLRMTILSALHGADPKGAVGYLKKMAQQEPVAFLGLIGKLLPKEVKVDSNVKVQQLNVHRLDISTLDENQLDALEGALRQTYMLEHQKVVDEVVVDAEYEEAGAEEQ